MDYDSWKLETPEDEAYRKMGRRICEDCDRARATNCCTTRHGPREYWLCEPCAERRDCPDCGGFGTEFIEDLTGHGQDDWLCVACLERRQDCEPDFDAPDAAERAFHQSEAMRLKR